MWRKSITQNRQSQFFWLLFQCLKTDSRRRIPAEGIHHTRYRELLRPVLSVDFSSGENAEMEKFSIPMDWMDLSKVSGSGF